MGFDRREGHRLKKRNIFLPRDFWCLCPFVQLTATRSEHVAETSFKYFLIEIYPDNYLARKTHCACHLDKLIPGKF